MSMYLCSRVAGGVCYERFQQLLLRLPHPRSPALIAVLFTVLDADNDNRLG